jgi:hypothetical protein
MSDFEKKFRSCGKVTSLSLSVNAISAENSAYGRLFALSDSREGRAAFFRAQTQLNFVNIMN